MKKCKHFMGKVGGYFYGFKCNIYHNGNEIIYSDGKRLEFDRTQSTGKHEKISRDKYVNEKCLGDCNQCSMYKV